LLALAIVVPVASAAALWLRLGSGPVTLPAAVADRIESRIDGAMSANRLSVARIAMERPPGAADGLDLVLHDVRLTDPDGSPRAALPTLRVGLSGEALLRGRVLPVRVDLAGAGLRLARDAQGRIDLALIAGDRASRLSLAETLTRLDAMLATPTFAELDSITGTGLGLTMADAMTGQVLRVRDARLRLERGKDGILDLSLGGALEGSRDAMIDLALTRDASTGTTNLGVGFEGLAARDVATIGPALAWLDLMRAPISGFLGGAILQDGTLGDMRVRLEIGAGQVALDAAAAPLRFDALQADLRYEAARGRISFDRLDLSAPDLSFTAAGHADAAPDGSRYTGQFRLSRIGFAPPEFYPEPLLLESASIDLRLTLAPRLTVEVGQAVIVDAGHRLTARGRLAETEAGALALSLDASLPEADLRDVLAYWPETAVPRTRAWLAENVAQGRLRGVDFALRRVSGDAPEHALSLDFDGLEMRALSNMPPIEAAAGYLSLVGSRLVLRLDSGHVTAPEAGGDVSLGGSVMTVADTRIEGPPARFDLSVDGALPDLLGVLQRPPVRLLQDSEMTPERIGTGHAALDVGIETRLMRQDGLGDTAYRVEGRIGDFASQGVIPGRSLRAGDLRVEADRDAVTVSGQARLDDLPFTGSWRRPLGPDAPRASQVDARARVDRARLAALGVALPDWMIAGETELAVQVDLVDGAAPELAVSSDLAGVTLSVPQLGWGLPASSTGQLEARLRLGPSPAITRLQLAAGSLDLQGSATLRAGGALDMLSLDALRLGGWLDVSGALVGRGAGRVPEIRITGGTVDLGGAPQGGGDGAGVPGAGPVFVTLDRLQVTEGIALTGLRAELTTEGGLSGRFDGRVNGAEPITGTLVSTADGPAVRIRAADGGAVLRAAGVFRSAYGGAMELILQATGAEGTYDGTLSMDSPRLRDAPVMAELLNLVSVVGLIDQLGGEGINLGDVDARFRLTPSEVILREGVAVGPALGLSMDGRYILGAQQLDMAGVISPLNALNGLVGALFSTRREGLFGFAYRLTGPSADPQVTVNPLSILTPGVFREIFRRPPPEVTDAP
jgi:hypothetical protein